MFKQGHHSDHRVKAMQDENWVKAMQEELRRGRRGSILSATMDTCAVNSINDVAWQFTQCRVKKELKWPKQPRGRYMFEQ